MKGLVGKKLGMTAIYTNEADKMIPCTLIEIQPCFVTQLKTEKNNGYEAIQIAFSEKRESLIKKSLLGELKKCGLQPLAKLKEFRYNDSDFFSVHSSKLKPGDKLSISDIFQEGDFIDVRGKSKGKGFQGVVKRHGFKGVGGRSHGQDDRERAPGSIGASSFPSRVFKGTRMAGRSGGRLTFVSNLKAVKIDAEKNLLWLSGSVPGAKKSTLVLTK